MFEEGTAATVRPRSLRFAYLPDLKGDVMLGHQFSKVNYDAEHLAEAPCALTPDGFFSAAFVGDTGLGKTMAASGPVTIASSFAAWCASRAS